MRIFAKKGYVYLFCLMTIDLNDVCFDYAVCYMKVLTSSEEEKEEEEENDDDDDATITIVTINVGAIIIIMSNTNSIY